MHESKGANSKLRVTKNSINQGRKSQIHTQIHVGKNQASESFFNSLAFFVPLLFVWTFVISQLAFLLFAQFQAFLPLDSFLSCSLSFVPSILPIVLLVVFRSYQLCYVPFRQLVFFSLYKQEKFLLFAVLLTSSLNCLLCGRCFFVCQFLPSKHSCNFFCCFLLFGSRYVRTCQLPFSVSYCQNSCFSLGCTVAFIEVGILTNFCLLSCFLNILAIRLPALSCVLT